MGSLNDFARKVGRDLADSNIEIDNWLMDTIDNHLDGMFDSPRKGVFYPSSIANPCDRMLWLSFNGLMPRMPLPPNLKRIFENGSSLEERVSKWFEDLGLLLDREISVKFADPPISGRIDFLIKHQDGHIYPIELKSINQRGFSALKRPKPEHSVQLQMYLNMGDFSRGSVLYECKDNQKLKAYAIERNEDEWQRILERCLKIQNMEDDPIHCTGEYYCDCKKVTKEDVWKMRKAQI